MKKIRIALLIFFSLLLVGCIGDNDKETVIKQLTNKKYILKDWELVKRSRTDAYGLFNDIVSYDYIYKTEDGKYNVVSILDNTSIPKEKYYEIVISYDCMYNSDPDIDMGENYFEFPKSTKKVSLKKKYLWWKAELLEEKEYNENNILPLYVTSYDEEGKISYIIEDESIVKLQKEDIDKKINDKGYYSGYYYFEGIKKGKTVITVVWYSKDGTERSSNYDVIVDERLNIKMKRTGN
ncbi:MAG: hypothetical protein IKP07_02080 [Bacilli bacterium]|nr:hypothetical protein [Bacilli bacterium]